MMLIVVICPYLAVHASWRCRKAILTATASDTSTLRGGLRSRQLDHDEHISLRLYMRSGYFTPINTNRKTSSLVLEPTASSSDILCFSSLNSSFRQDICCQSHHPHISITHHGETSRTTTVSITILGKMLLAEVLIFSAEPKGKEDQPSSHPLLCHINTHLSTRQPIQEIPETSLHGLFQEVWR
jgi:hypothetical protein